MIVQPYSQPIIDGPVMTIGSLLFALVLVAGLLFFVRNARRLIGYLNTGRPDDRFDQPGRRVGNVLSIAFGQTKLLREPLAGLLHFFIFWGFVILLSAVLESIIEGLIPGGSLAFLGPLYPPLIFLQDAVGLLVVIAVVVSIVRRIAAPPKRLDVSGHARMDALVILTLILVVMVTMFGQNAMRFLAGAGAGQDARVLSAWLGTMLSPMDPGTASTWFHVFFWAHMLTVLGFLNYLPYSKHLHVLTSIPNVYFSNLGPRGALRPINLADETLTKYGATDVDDLTWKQLLDGYTCTECGRCSSVCPANTTGKLLNPKKIIVDIRARTMEKAPVMVANATGDAAGKVLGHQLLDNFITEQELWACTTCMACVQECPVTIEHVDAIVQIRRGLVLNESRFPDELKTTFSNLERNFTPWGFGHAARAEWAEGLAIPRMAEKKRVDVLFWVGCAGSYDARYRSVSRAFAQLLQKAGVDFAILGEEEKCTGDPARRMGNEYLAQSLITDNVSTLNSYSFSRIVVTCPHCMQALGKEYRQFGGTYEVVHHTTVLRELMLSGKLQIPAGSAASVAFHDPCYLGRYNDEYDAPRDVLDALGGIRRLEMPRSMDRSFCCGAGGGRMWMEETEGKRINMERTDEALATSPDVIGTGCPFCMTMLTDGVKAREAAERVQVRDVAELVLEALEPGGNR